jgi:hypothetical protein
MGRSWIVPNEHSLDDQRTYNLACWALGANSEIGGRTAQFVGLPESRAVRCPDEYAVLNGAMRNYFVNAYSGQRDRSFRSNVTAAHGMVLRAQIVMRSVTIDR